MLRHNHTKQHPLPLWPGILSALVSYRICHGYGCNKNISNCTWELHGACLAKNINILKQFKLVYIVSRMRSGSNLNTELYFHWVQPPLYCQLLIALSCNCISSAHAGSFEMQFIQDISPSVRGSPAKIPISRFDIKHTMCRAPKVLNTRQAENTARCLRFI